MIDKQFIVERNGKSFVLYAGLLSTAHDQGLKRITTKLLQVPSDDNGQVAIVSAEVETDRGTFSGIGDASPANVARAMLTVTIRLAETRAKARALRDAVNVGVAALEELGDIDNSHDQRQSLTVQPVTQTASQEPSDSDRATADQRRAVERLAKAAGRDLDSDGLTRSEAGLLIQQLQPRRLT